MARYSAEMFKNKGKFWMALVDSEGHDETNGLVGVTKDCKTEADAKAEATRIWGKILKED
jgi:hypothetical protein